MLPPMSEPTPITEPAAARMQPSPPARKTKRVKLTQGHGQKLESLLQLPLTIPGEAPPEVQNSDDARYAGPQTVTPLKPKAC